MASRKATAGAKRQPKRNGQGRPGRPHDLDKPIPQPDGGEITAADAIIRHVRTGLPLNQAAPAIGVSHDAAYRWRGEGASVASALTEKRLTRSKLTAYQKACIEFYERLTQAEAEAEALNAARISRAAAGGFVTRREVVEYDAQGNVVSRKVTEATQAPDTKAAMFWLERRAPERWGRAARLEHALADGPGVVQTDSPLEKLTAALDAIERRREAGDARLEVIEGDASEEEASA